MIMIKYAETLQQLKPKFMNQFLEFKGLNIGQFVDVYEDEDKNVIGKIKLQSDENIITIVLIPSRVRTEESKQKRKKMTKQLTYEEVLETSKTLNDPEIFIYNKDEINNCSITLINDGDGAKPIGKITYKVFCKLKENEKLSNNIYVGHRGHRHKLYMVLGK